MGKNLSNKYCPNFLIVLKKSTTDAIKTVSKGAIRKTAGTTSQPVCNVSGTSPKGSLKVLMSGTSRGPSENSQVTNKIIDDLMNKAIVLVLHIYYCFYWKNKHSKVINGDVHGTCTGPSCGTSRGPNDRTFLGRLRDVGDTYFLNSTHKHIKLTLTGYSRLYSEL